MIKRLFYYRVHALVIVCDQDFRVFVNSYQMRAPIKSFLGSVDYGESSIIRYST